LPPLRGGLARAPLWRSSPVAFNLEDDYRFKDSLESLDKAVARNTILSLLEIQQAELN